MKLCPKCQKQFSDDANFCPVDAARLVAMVAQAAGTDSLTQRFELGQRLGGTRTGAVHKAVDKTTGAPCVVKLIAPAVVALPGVAQRLERELKQLERVKSAGVCHVIASGKRPKVEAPGFTPGAGIDESWVATELLDGAQTLAEAISARGPLPSDQAADLIELIGEALIEAAQVGVVHRDLAPKNILFAGNDIKLINFSLPVPTTDRVPGVPEFVAPEQVEGRPVDQRSNLYSLGALYYYVLTGQTIFEGSPQQVHQQHVSGQVKPPSQLVPIASNLEAVILRALDRSPTKRFLTVRQFVDEVQRVGHGEVIELKQTVAMGRAGRPKGELVQTLLGMKGGLPSIASAPTINPQPAVSPVQQLAAAVMPVPAPPVLPQAVSSPPPGARPEDGPPAMPPPAHLPGGGMAAALSSPPVAMAPLTPPTGVEQPRSPWAPPGGQPAAAPAPVPVASAPAPAPESLPAAATPIVVAAPAAPTVSGKAAGKKKAAEPDDSKGRFRETMWFKKGELDAQAAVAAAEERARTGKDAGTDKADTRPMDERYNDDGTITRSDKEKYSLRTGGTEMMPAMRDGGKASMSLTKVSEDDLIGEMKGLPKWLIAALVLGVIAIVVVILLLAM